MQHMADQVKPSVLVSSLSVASYIFYLVSSFLVTILKPRPFCIKKMFVQVAKQSNFQAGSLEIFK